MIEDKVQSSNAAQFSANLHAFHDPAFMFARIYGAWYRHICTKKPGQSCSRTDIWNERAFLGMALRNLRPGIGKSQNNFCSRHSHHDNIRDNNGIYSDVFHTQPVVRWVRYSCRYYRFGTRRTLAVTWLISVKVFEKIVQRLMIALCLLSYLLHKVVNYR